MEDRDGHPVENATSRVFVRVSGNGYLAGLDNGDSTDREEYKTISRRLFSGKLLAVVAAGTEPGEIKVEISSSGMEPATVVLQAEACETEEGIGADAWRIDESRAQKETEQYCEDIPVRALRLQAPTEPS